LQRIASSILRIAERGENQCKKTPPQLVNGGVSKVNKMGFPRRLWEKNQFSFDDEGKSRRGKRKGGHLPKGWGEGIPDKLGVVRTS